MSPPRTVPFSVEDSSEPRSGDAVDAEVRSGAGEEIRVVLGEGEDFKDAMRRVLEGDMVPLAEEELPEDGEVSIVEEVTGDSEAIQGILFGPEPLEHRGYESLEDILGRVRLESRPYQRAIIRRVVDQFLGRDRDAAGFTDPPARSILVESPTGSGKTALALMASRALQGEPGGGDPLVCWVAMRRNLLSQAFREDADKEILVRDLHFLSMFSREVPARLKKRWRGDRKLLMVIDEGQHDSAASCAHLHNVLEPDYVLALTATPYRTDRLKLMFEKVVRDAGIHQLIQQGYLSEYWHYTIPAWGPDQVADCYLQDPERWGTSLVFFLRLEDCYRFQARLREAQIHCEVVTAKTDRVAQLEAFSQGAFPVIANAMVLAEGFDHPALKTVFVRDASKLPTVQMAGRVFRKHTGLLYKQVVQSRATPWPFVRTAHPRHHLVWENNRWLTLEANDEIERVSADIMAKMADVRVVLPEFIRKRTQYIAKPLDRSTP